MTTEIVIDVVSPIEFALDETGDEFGEAAWLWPNRIFDWENIEGADHVEADRSDLDRNDGRVAADRIGGADLAA
jgi:hypothetical protein